MVANSIPYLNRSTQDDEEAARQQQQQQEEGQEQDEGEEDGEAARKRILLEMARRTKPAKVRRRVEMWVGGRSHKRDVLAGHIFSIGVRVVDRWLAR